MKLSTKTKAVIIFFLFIFIIVILCISHPYPRFKGGNLPSQPSPGHSSYHMVDTYNDDSIHMIQDNDTVTEFEKDGLDITVQVN